jgi:tRNA (pseudouridine54-N1)-methyltransferase
MLDETAPDLRDEVGLEGPHVAFFAGDHLGFDAATRARLDGLGARPVSVGPVRVHTEDALTIVSNELDRRGWRSDPLR